MCFSSLLFLFRALGKIAEFIELDDARFISAFQSMVPNMVGVLQQALEKSDEDAALKGFEVFDELLYLVNDGWREFCCILFFMDLVS